MIVKIVFCQRASSVIRIKSSVSWESSQPGKEKPLLRRPRSGEFYSVAVWGCSGRHLAHNYPEQQYNYCREDYRTRTRTRTFYYVLFVLQCNFYSDSQSCILLQHNRILQPAPPQLIFDFLSRRATILTNLTLKVQTDKCFLVELNILQSYRRYNYVATEIWQQQIMGIKKMKSSESENTEIGQVMGAIIAM